jgi:hypothetical protein
LASLNPFAQELSITAPLTTNQAIIDLTLGLPSFTNVSISISQTEKLTKYFPEFQLYILQHRQHSRWVAGNSRNMRKIL